VASFTTRCTRAARTRRLATGSLLAPGSRPLAAINLILILERDFGVDFASLLDVKMIDTIWRSPTWREMARIRAGGSRAAKLSATALEFT
jgi:hypothetical protein